MFKSSRFQNAYLQRLLSVGVLMFACILAASAQDHKIDFLLEGTVRTVAGGIVPATRITVTDKGGKSLSSSSGRDGSYKFELNEGIYQVRFESEGFKILTVTNVEIPLPKVARLDVALEPGRCSDCNGELVGERWDDFTILAGTIYDKVGAVIPRVNVKARGEDGIDRVATSNDEGYFELRIRIGQNKLHFECPGFELFVLEKYRTIRTYKEKMALDVVLVGSNPEPCGYGGDCGDVEEIKAGRAVIINKISPRPLLEGPKQATQKKKKKK